MESLKDIARVVAAILAVVREGLKARAAGAAALPMEALAAVLAAKSRACGHVESIRNQLVRTYVDICAKGARAYLSALASDARAKARDVLTVAQEKSMVARKEAVEHASSAALRARTAASGVATAVCSAAADKKA